MVSIGLPIRKLLMDIYPPLTGNQEEIKKPPAAVFISAIALPNAYEVSCRARVWKYPILKVHDLRNTPLLPVPPHPFIEQILATRCSKYKTLKTFCQIFIRKKSKEFRLKSRWSLEDNNNNIVLVKTNVLVKKFTALQ